MSSRGAEGARQTEHASTSRTRSPEDGEHGSNRKRRRKVLSCLACRRRKVQCDRQSPACGRCVKAGLVAKCSYVEDNGIPDDGDVVEYGRLRALQQSGHLAPIHAAIAPHDGSQEALRARLHAQDLHIQQLENALARKTHSVPLVHPTPLGIQESRELANDTTGLNGAAVPSVQPLIFRGKAFKTEYSGPSSSWGTIAQVGDFHHFTREAMEKSPRLQRIRSEMHARDNEEVAIPHQADQATPSAEDVDLRALLPSQREADAAVQLYLATFGTIYHIIHLPSFWKAYDSIRSPTGEATPSNFIAVVLLMISTVACIDMDGSRNDPNAAFKSRSHATAMIDTCERWVDKQNHKRGAAETMQIYCLLLLSKSVNAHKSKRRSTDVGSLMLRMMSMGFHRSPNHLRKTTSEVDKELRRRMWATIADLELEISFERGIVSVPWLAQSDNDAPRNMRDESIEDGAAPAELPASTFTPSSYLALASKSFSLRSKLNAKMNSIGAHFTFEEIMQYTDELSSLSQAMPLPADASPHSVRGLLQLKHLQYILALHSTFLRSATSIAQRNVSTTVVLDTATTIVNIHSDLLERGNCSILLLRQDYVRAAFALAQVVLKTAATASPDVYSRLVGDSTPALLERITALLTARVLRLGCEHKQLWFVLAAKAYTKSFKDPSQRSVYQQEAIDAVVALHDKINEAKQREGVAVGHEGSSAGATPWALGSQPFGIDSTLSLNFDEMGMWPFEDWMMDPIDWQNDANLPMNGNIFQGYG